MENMKLTANLSLHACKAVVYSTYARDTHQYHHLAECDP